MAIIGICVFGKHRDMIVHYYGHHHRGSGLGSIFARIFGKVASKVAAKTAIRSVAKVAGKTLKTVAKKALPVVKEAGISLAKEAAQYGAQQAAEAVQQAGEKAKKHGVPLSIINKVTAVANKGIETGKGELHKKLLKVAGAPPKTPRKRSRPSGTTTTRTAAPRKKSRTSSSLLSDTTNIPRSPSFINSQQPQPFQTVQAPTPQTQTQSSSFQVPKTIQSSSTGLSKPQRKNFGKKRSTKSKTVVSTALKRRRSSTKSKSPSSAASSKATRPGITQALIDSL